MDLLNLTIYAALAQRRTRIRKNLINGAAFNRINTVCHSVQTLNFVNTRVGSNETLSRILQNIRSCNGFISYCLLDRLQENFKLIEKTAKDVQNSEALAADVVRFPLKSLC